MKSIKTESNNTQIADVHRELTSRYREIECLRFEMRQNVINTPHTYNMSVLMLRNGEFEFRKRISINRWRNGVTAVLNPTSQIDMENRHKIICSYNLTVSYSKYKNAIVFSIIILKIKRKFSSSFRYMIF